MDLDNIFKFCTPKYVYIRDAKLGILKYAFMAAIFAYVVVYQILYTCDHLKPHHAAGFGNIRLEEPLAECDADDAPCHAQFDNIANLKYCTQYIEPKRELLSAGEEQKEEKSHLKEAKAAEAGDYITPPKKCKYYEHRRLEWESAVPSEVFIPTFVKRVKQSVDPSCYDPKFNTAGSGQAGSKKYRCKSLWKTEEIESYYIADIEDFTLHMSHSFSSPDIGLHGVSTDYQGLFAACPTNHPADIKAECKRMKIPNTSGAMAAEDEVGLVSTESMEVESLRGSSEGEDELRLGALLKMTPLAQDLDIKHNIMDVKFPKNLGYAESLREGGGMLLLDVSYSNDGYSRPGIPGLGAAQEIKPITYTYRPFFIPTTTNAKYQVVQSLEGNSDKERILDIWHGITVKFQFQGKLVVFAWRNILKALTTGLVLLASATTIVVSLASFVLPLQEKYNTLMYQPGEDLSDYTTLKNNAKDFKGLKAAFCSGDTLIDCLGEDGQPNKELSHQNMTRILAVTEMRLNRLDGMDPKMTFIEDNEKNKVNQAIGHLEKSFYSKPEVGLPASTLSNMAFAKRLNPKVGGAE